jgi:hypothetical protein
LVGAKRTQTLSMIGFPLQVYHRLLGHPFLNTLPIAYCSIRFIVTLYWVLT